jgi:hypothetical protein
MNAFGAALALDQVRDRQIFNRNRVIGVIGIDDPATVLVRKVIPLLPHLFLVHDQAALSRMVRCGSWEQSK